MKRKHPLTPFILLLSCLISAGVAADEAPPAIAPQPAAGAKVQIQIQGGGNVQIQGGGRVQMQMGAVQIQGAVGAVAADAGQPGIGVPPVIFLPGVPSVLIPNPLAKSDAKPGFLGVQLEMAADVQADEEDKKKNVGVGIETVIEDSPAAKAGLKDGDRVLTLEGKEAKDSAQLREMIRALRPEQNVKLTVRRDGKDMEIKAKLGAAPDPVAAGQMLQLNGGVFGLAGQNAPQAVPGVVSFQNASNFVRSSSGNTSATPADKDSVTLRDGNRFLGKIRGIDPVKGLLLQREGLSELELIEEEISGLTFADREKGADAPKPATASPLPRVVLQLRDGSILYGDALTMENGMVQFTLPGGQRIEIPRAHAQSATLSDGESPQIYDGPTAMAGWTSGRYNQARWEYKDGTLRTSESGAIGRNLGRFPDPLDMSFEVNFPKQMQHVGVSLFANNVGESGVGALTLNFSPGQIYGNHYDGKRSNQYNTNFANAAVNDFSSKPETIRYRILVDRVNGTALVYVNGEKRADWKLSKVKPEDLGKCGAAFSITPHASMSNATFKLGRVRILPWNGKVPAGGAEPPEPKGDEALSSNGTTTNGTLDRITGSEILFANPAGKAVREKTVFVRFADPAAPKESAAAIANARLRNGSEISAAKVRGTGDTLTITTRSGPEITLPFTALRSLDFLQRDGQAPLASRNLDVLTLTDGTQLTGRALLPLAGTVVNWKIAASRKLMEFPSDKVAGLLLRSTEGARKSTPMKGESVLRFANGDWLAGDIVSLDAKQLVMKTDLAPQMTVPASGLRALYLNPDTAATVADGATGADSWTDGWSPNRANSVTQNAAAGAKTERPWKYHDGEYAIGTPPRNGQQMISKKWPPYIGAYALNFEVSTPNRSTYFAAQLFNSKDERTFSITASGTRLYVYFNPGFSRVNRAMARPKQIQIENKTESADATVRVSLVLDRPAKTFRVFIAGKEVGKIPFKEDEAKEALDACGLTIATSFGGTNASQNRIGHIWLAPWNGSDANALAAKGAKTPANDEPKKEAVPAAGDAEKAVPTPLIFLANGDDFPGAIERITSDVVTVNSEAGPLEFPGKRVAWIHFPSPVGNASDHFPRLRFHDRGLLSVNDLQVGDERVKCKMLDGQVLDFPLGVVKEIVWRPLGTK